MTRLIDCTPEAHAAHVLDILNDAILHTTALYEYRPRSLESLQAWFEAKRAGNFPVLGAEDEHGQLLGFASYGPFRPHAAYKYSIEHSVYVHVAHRARGVGSALLARLIELATEQQYHCMVGGIDRDNGASIALHERLGFRRAGTLQQAGFKFGRWLDLVFYQRLLDTPAHPADG